ncbi:hypothetical protein TBK1r_50300 [Stieleria magnilauensis]|uniref:Uncharacterized protein n=1 Tax=Stieleria magnilauensis TaxID=2527963 RepID=A0ABX5XVE9_9BACT|nr:hypothetical protein TBK1r_50300 [Planctomycetes bacterium TBK1r]
MNARSVLVHSSLQFSRMADNALCNLSKTDAARWEFAIVRGRSVNPCARLDGIVGLGDLEKQIQRQRWTTELQGSCKGQVLDNAEPVIDDAGLRGGRLLPLCRSCRLPLLSFTFR